MMALDYSIESINSRSSTARRFYRVMISQRESENEAIVERSTGDNAKKLAFPAELACSVDDTITSQRIPVLARIRRSQPAYYASLYAVWCCLILVNSKSRRDNM